MYSYDIDYYKDVLCGHSSMSPNAIDDKSQEKIKELFAVMKNVQPISKDSERRLIWLRASNGNMQDYTDKYMRHYYYADDEEDNEQESREYAREDYLATYSENYKWFRLELISHTDRDGVPFYGVVLDYDYILAINDPNVNIRGYLIDVVDFIEYLIRLTKESVSLVKAGMYENVIAELPYKNRYGTIIRKDYWDLFPKERADFLSGLSHDEVDAFIQTAESKPENIRSEMTAREFYEACKTGYQAAGYQKKESWRFTDTDEERRRYGGTTAREMYYWYADGRDDGLQNVPLDDSEAFLEWTEGKGEYFEFNGHHPYEIVSSGSLIYSIHLYPIKDKNGWTLMLSSSRIGRSTEMVKMFLAMRKHGLPVVVSEASALVARYKETDTIGILPDTLGAMNPYAFQSFPLKVTDVITLPEKSDAQYETLCNKVTWLPESKCNLYGVSA